MMTNEEVLKLTMINEKVLMSLIEEFGTNNRMECDIWLNNHFKLRGLRVNDKKIYVELLKDDIKHNRSYVIHELLGVYQKLIFNKIVRLFLNQKPELVIELL